MAFTKTPMQDSSQNKSVPLLYKWDSRDDSSAGYDTVLKNALIEPVGEEYFHVIKRPGAQNYPLTGSVPTGPIVGAYYWEAAKYLVLVCMSNVSGTGDIKVSSAGSVSQAGIIPTLLTADTEVGFTEFLYQNGTIELLIMVNSQLFKLTTAGVLTGITIPAGTYVPSVVFLDGYAFIASSTAILNSNLNDPSTWSASNFLNVDSYPDPVYKLTRVGPYLVALGGESIQYFYDAANPTGTPLAANVGATKRISYLGGFANYGDDVLFIGAANQGNPSLYRISGLKVEPVVSFPFARMWNGIGSQYSSAAAQSGSILDLNGHSTYFVRTASKAYAYPDTPPNVPVGASYIYDLDTGAWSKIGYQSQEFYLIKQATTFNEGGAGGSRMTYFIVLGQQVVERFNPVIYQDDGVNFEVKMRTKPWDFGTFRNKFGGRLLLQGDQTATTSLAYVSWSDNDYKTTSTPRPIDLQYEFQQLYGLGSFRKRSFTLTYADNFPMRWRVIELDYEQGTA